MTRVAAIDCGTNSIRLLISEIQDDGKVRDITRTMEIIRLERESMPLAKSPLRL